MDNDIFSHFPDRETFDRYWNENYVPVTYEDVATVFRDFVKSAEGHIYLSDYEEKGCISKEDFKDNLSQEAQFAFQDGLTEVFYDKNPELYETAFALFEEAQMTGQGDASVAQTFHETFNGLYEEFLDTLFEEILTGRIERSFMATLGIPQNTIAVLQKYHFNFQKKFGQNFLIDPHVLEKIVEAAGVTKDDFVLEIGPGIGTMTQYLCENAREVTAVEIDTNLIPILEDTLSAYDNVTVINQDILKLDIAKLAMERNGGKPIKVVANLPYYITTPIIMGLFESHVPIDSITVMVQKEVADRMQVGPGTKDYGALSLAVQFYAKPQIVANVPPNCFMPRPNVGSAVIRLTRHEEVPVQVDDEKLMFHIIRASFNQRRKTLANGLSNAPQVHLSKEEIQECIAELGEPLTIRGEALTLEQFAALSNIIGNRQKK